MKDIKFLILLITFLPACAPERAQFSLPKVFKTAKTQQNVKSNPTAVASGTLTVKLPDPLRVELVRLFETIDSNNAELAVGTYRLLKRKNQVTRAIEIWRQEVVAIDKGVATLTTQNTANGDVFPSEKIGVDEIDQFETGLRALVNNDLATLEVQVREYLGAFALLNKFTLPPATPLELEVAAATYIDNATFKVRLRVKATELTDLAPLALDVHLVPNYPGAFRVTYKSWGKGAPTQALLDVQIVQ